MRMVKTPEPDAPSPGPTRPLRSPYSLHVTLSEDLRRRLDAEEWEPESKLPTEAQLCETYGVSRSTVRLALKVLESQGLIQSRHGQGTFVTRRAAGIRAGLEELRSITTTIAEQGHEPGMKYRSSVIRDATPEETQRLDLHDPRQVLAVERAVLADGVVVAFSYDSLPAELVPEDFQPAELTGSILQWLERRSGVV
ncbi:MAG: GntR family transcriptional regulator, partial [Candidatus Dormibacteria bacterium]